MGKARDEMTAAERKAETVRVRIASRQTRARKRAEKLRGEGKADEALRVLRDAGLSADGKRLEDDTAILMAENLRAPLLPEESGTESEESVVSAIPLSEYVGAGEISGILGTLFRIGVNPDDVLSGSERDWLREHDFGETIVAERMDLKGLGDDYRAWADSSL